MLAKFQGDQRLIAKSSINFLNSSLLGTYVNIELANPLTKHTFLVIG